MRTELSKIILFLIILTLLGCLSVKNINTTKSVSKVETNISKATLNVSNFAVYYGKNKIEKLSNYDLVIIDPDNYSKDEITYLKKSSIVVAYLSLGEVDKNRKYYNEVKDCIIGKNPTWDSYYINVSCEEWKDLILNHRIPEILNKGFDGVFLDTVDTVDLFPSMKKDVIEIIKNIRKSFPDLVIIQNRGFTIIDETANYIDGVVFESFTSHYNWSSNKYELWSGADLKWINSWAEKLSKMREKYGLIILTLDYADNEELVAICKKHAEKYGFTSFISKIDLMQI